MKVVFKLWNTVRGHGYDPAAGAETPNIDLQNLTMYKFIIAKARIYFAVPPALVAATQFDLPGLSALLPPPVSVVPTDDYVLPLERFQSAIIRNWI